MNRNEIKQKVTKYIHSEIECGTWLIPYHESQKWFGRISLIVDFSTGEFAPTTLKRGTYITITEYIERPENWEELIYRNIEHDLLVWPAFYEMKELEVAIDKIVNKYMEIFYEK